MARYSLMGSIMVFVGVLIYAFDTVLIKLSCAEGYTAGFWRGFSAFICVMIVFPIIYGRKSITRLREGGIYMALSGILYGIGGVLYTNSVSINGTSLSLIMLSLTPIITSVLSIPILGEHPMKSSWISMIVCFGCIIMMFKDGLSHGMSVIGFVIGIMIPIALSLNFINLRAHPAIPRLGVTMIGGLAAAIVCVCARRLDVWLPFSDMRYLLILGFAVIPIGQFLIMSGTKYISASETTLINSLECIFGMAYVFIFTKEAPSHSEIACTAIILCAVVFNVMMESRSQKQDVG